MLSRRAFLIGCMGAAVAASPAAYYSAIYEPADLEVVSRTFRIRDLPARLDGFRVVQVSDLHMTSASSIHVQMVERVQALKPDAVFVTGDLVDTSSAVTDLVGLLGNLDAPAGIWAVPGNWDHTANAIDSLTTALPTAKVKLLINQSQPLEDGLWIVGVDDPASGNDQLEEAVKDVPSGARRLLLAHSPDIVPNLGGQTFDLILAGHTHGGQINLPFLNGTWLRDGPTREYVQGLYQVQGSPLYVNRGIGMTTLPVRIHCRPEITHMTLHGA